MTESHARREGQPVLFLGLLLAGWMLLRAISWDIAVPEARELPMVAQLAAAERVEQAGGLVRPEVPKGDRRARREWSTAVKARLPEGLPGDLLLRAIRPESYPNVAVVSGADFGSATGGARRTVPDRTSGESVEPLGAEEWLWKGGARRWHLDAWILLRQDAAPPTASGLWPAVYGASQLGAVLSFRLAPRDRHRPALFLRVNRALIDGGQWEGALGARYRPVPSIPVAAYIELRATETSESVEIRPAAYVAGGVDDVPVPADFRARGYAQAGYVGGDFDSLFADGRLTVDHRLTRSDRNVLAIGAAAWGGAQREAERLDLGPAARLDFRLGDKPFRLEADYRYRVAGDAEPGSGGALTLSTGFWTRFSFYRTGRCDRARSWTSTSPSPICR